MNADPKGNVIITNVPGAAAYNVYDSAGNLVTTVSATSGAATTWASGIITPVNPVNPIQTGGPTANFIAQRKTPPTFTITAVPNSSVGTATNAINTNVNTINGTGRRPALMVVIFILTREGTQSGFLEQSDHFNRIDQRQIPREANGCRGKQSPRQAGKKMSI